MSDQKNPMFPFLYPLERLEGIDGMLKQLQNTFGEDFWRNINQLANQTIPTQQSESSMPATNEAQSKPFFERVPYELWETDQQFYLLVHLPGLKGVDSVSIVFPNSRTILLQARIPKLRPGKNYRRIYSEVLEGFVERQIELPEGVNTGNYSSYYKRGILFVSLMKLNKPVDFLADFFPE